MRYSYILLKPFKQTYIVFLVNSRASTSPVPPPSTGGSLPRPGTKQITVTVQETVVEPAQSQQQPPPTMATNVVRHQHHASNATKELDDLMASLSDFKVSYFYNCPCIYQILSNLLRFQLTWWPLFKLNHFKNVHLIVCWKKPIKNNSNVSVCISN